MAMWYRRKTFLLLLTRWSYVFVLWVNTKLETQSLNQIHQIHTFWAMLTHCWCTCKSQTNNYVSRYTDFSTWHQFAKLFVGMLMNQVISQLIHKQELFCIFVIFDFIFSRWINFTFMSLYSMLFNFTPCVNQLKKKKHSCCSIYIPWNIEH